jgi:thioredoxin 1
MVDEINSIEEFDSISKSDVVVVDFFAEWCMPCIMMAPVIDEVAAKLKKVKFTKVNVDDYQDIAQKFGVMSIPTMVVLKKGKEVNRWVGASSAEALEENVKKSL